MIGSLEATLLNNLAMDGFTLKLGSFGKFSVRHKPGIRRKNSVHGRNDSDEGQAEDNLVCQRGVPLEEVCALGSHPLENWLENFEVSRQPVPGRSQNPDAVLLTPAPFAVMLAKLAFFPCDDDPDRTATFLDVADQFLDVAFGDSRLVLVVHENARLQRSAAGIAVRQDEITVLRQLLAD